MAKRKNNYSSSRSTAEIRQLLVPSLAQASLELTVGITLLLLINVRSLLRHYTTDIAPASPQSFSELLEENIPFISNSVNNLQDRYSSVIFWVFMGFVLYACIWFVANIVINVRNDITADKYQHPSNYDRRSFWTAVLSTKLLFIAIIVIGLVYILTASKLMVLLASLVFNAIVNSGWVGSAATIIVCSIATTVLIHVFVVLLRLLRNSWQIIYKDL